MKLLLPNDTGSAWFTTRPLILLFVFTFVASIGYAIFGLHPERLQWAPQLAGFFGTAFTFFARGQVLVSAAVLVVYLVYRRRRAWIGAFVLVYMVSLSSELAGTRFGIPFGDYAYTGLLGGKWFGLVPYLIPLSWFTMTIPAYALARIAVPSGNVVLRIALAAFLLTVWDLSLDPAMSYLTTYWTWGEAGPYYGMPLINLAGWYATGLVLMSALYVMRTDHWIEKLSPHWMALYYFLVLLMPLAMTAAAGLWGAVAATTAGLALPVWFIVRNLPPTAGRDASLPEPLVVTDTSNGEQRNALQNFFKLHSRSFSFAARFFSPEEYRLVTNLYAFCRTTDDFADRYAPQHGTAQAEIELDAWESKVRRAYEGIPSGIAWLDELMSLSARSGVPYEIIGDLIDGVRSDLGRVELGTVEALERYAHCVASVVGIWLCYLFGVREREVLDRAAAMGRAMQITNILRDVGEDLRMDRIYLPAELMRRHGITRSDLHAMEAGAVAPTESYKSLLEDLMERAEADYRYAFRGLAALPASFARAAAVASEVYKGIHRAIRKRNYDNFNHRAYTMWFDKAFLALRALARLRSMQKRPFLPNLRGVYRTHPKATADRKAETPIVVSSILAAFLTMGAFAASPDARIVQDSAPFLSSMMYYSESPVVVLRSFYLAGVEDEGAIEEGLSFYDELQQQEPVHRAYRAALIVLKAKHAFWPMAKMKYLREGLPQLDELVLDYPDHVEIRYLRLLSCYYLPRFLGRMDSVNDDLVALARLLPHAHGSFPGPLYEDMSRFVRENEKLIIEVQETEAKP